MFTVVVINDTRIAKAVKLQHLLNNVQGTKKKQVLRGVKVNSTNFKVACDKLLRRYDDKKRRLNCYLEALINLPVVVKKSFRELSLLVDRAEEAVRCLEDLACPIDQYDNWFVHLIV